MEDFEIDPLRDGNGANSPISDKYVKAIMASKRWLIEQCQGRTKQFKFVAERFKIISKAVNYTNFAFAFQNNVDVRASQEVEKRYNELRIKYTNIMTETTSAWAKRIDNNEKFSLVDLKDAWENVRVQVTKDLQTEKKKFLDDQNSNAFISKYKGTFDKLEERVNNEINDRQTILLERKRAQSYSQEIKNNMEEIKNFAARKAVVKAEELQRESGGANMSHEQKEKEWLRIWDEIKLEWCERSSIKSKKFKTLDPDQDANDFVRTTFAGRTGEVAILNAQQWPEKPVTGKWTNFKDFSGEQKASYYFGVNPANKAKWQNETYKKFEETAANIHRDMVCPLIYEQREKLNSSKYYETRDYIDVIDGLTHRIIKVASNDLQPNYPY